MNLVQQSEQLKNIPDAALMQMQGRPTSVPPYLVVAEMQRRETMRKASQAETGGNPMQQKTVAEEMVGQMQQGAPQMPMPQPQMQGGMPPMRMAEGGLASLSNYFQQMQGSNVPTDAQMVPVAPPMQYPGDPEGLANTYDEMVSRHGKRVTAADKYKEFTGMRKSNLGAEAERLAAQEKETRDRKPKLGEILMQLGLGMAGSRNNSFLGALADGGGTALHGYTQERNRRNGQADEIQRRRIGLMSQIDQNDDEMMHRSVEAARSENANQAMYGQSVEANLRALAGNRASEQRSKGDNDTRIEVERMRGVASAAGDSAKEDRADKRANRGYASAEKVAAIKASRPKGDGEASQGKFEQRLIAKSNAHGILANHYDEQLKDIRALFAQAVPTDRPALQAQMDELSAKARSARVAQEGYMKDLDGKDETLTPPPKRQQAKQPPPAKRGLMNFVYPSLNAMK